MRTSEGPNRIFEVTGGGEKVWEMWLESASGDSEQRFGAYRAERIPTLVEEL